MRLGRTFDAVFVHDAIEYMTTEADLRQAVATAYEHCRPGGVAVLVPDDIAENFEPATDPAGMTPPTAGASATSPGRPTRTRPTPDPEPSYAFLLRSPMARCRSRTTRMSSACFRGRSGSGCSPMRDSGPARSPR